MRTAATSQNAAAKSPPVSKSPHAALLLQRKCACGGASRISGECEECQSRRLQRKLTIGASNDPLEHEADRVADQVLAASAHSPIRNSPQRIQRVTGQAADDGGAAPASVDRVLSGAGMPLEPALRQDMEQRFGHDFSSVRVHSGGAAEQSARNVNANAYTAGHNIVFGAGRFAPGTHEGRRLLAHELTHVVQQEAHAWPLGTYVQRKREPGSEDADKIAAPKSTAAMAPKLDLILSKNGPPCACLVVVHNDERNARKTAGLMHANCAYNLALVNPDTSNRLIKIPGKKGSVDPNSLFPRGIAERCTKDKQSCRDFLANTAGTTDKDEIEQFVQTEFFLTVADCSSGFSLPVVALHNNDIEDTKNYLSKKDKVGVSDLNLDVDKSKKETGDDQIAKLKNLIKQKFGERVETEMMETAGKTNIFRWCASKDLSQCHIGDPDHPDNVTWVTNKKDFAALKNKSINVAIQSELPAKNSESEGDLSTLFLLLKDIFHVQDAKFLLKLINALKSEFGGALPSAAWPKLLIILQLLENRREKLRYINIESPGKSLSDQTDAERIRNYEAIVEILKAAGLHCCGEDMKKAEESIKEGLKKK